MPKSKRNKQISLTRTHKNALELKKNLVQEVHSCVDSYANVFVFSVNDMRNSKLKDVREQWRHSRFLFGKNKVMALALGRTAEEEYKSNLHKISNRLRGQCGLLFSNKSEQEVQTWFNDYAEPDYARSGNTATCDVVLKEGPATQFHFSSEPYLRQLGMPTELKRGIVHLLKDFQVCNEGDILTPEKAKILELIDHKMAEFKMTIECFWSNSGKFTELKKSSQPNGMDIDEEEEIAETPKTNGISKQKSKSNSVDVEEMDLQEEIVSEKDGESKDVESADAEDIAGKNVEKSDEDASEDEDSEGTPEGDDDNIEGTPEGDDDNIEGTPEGGDDDNIEGTPEGDDDNIEGTLEDDHAEGASPDGTDDDNVEETNKITTRDVEKSSKVEIAAVTPVHHKNIKGKIDEPSPFKEPQSVPGKSKKQKQQVESSPDEKSPIFRSLRNRTVKIKRKK